MTVAEDYPDIKHEIVVKRALQRKKTFKANGSTGYRDYLVWQTCLEVPRRYASEEIHFITENTRDFADQNDREKLHPALLADLTEMKIPGSRLRSMISMTTTALIVCIKGLICFRQQEVSRNVFTYRRNFGYVTSYG